MAGGADIQVLREELRKVMEAVLSDKMKDLSVMLAKELQGILGTGGVRPPSLKQATIMEEVPSRLTINSEISEPQLGAAGLMMKRGTEGPRFLSPGSSPRKHSKQSANPADRASDVTRGKSNGRHEWTSRYVRNYRKSTWLDEDDSSDDEDAVHPVSSARPAHTEEERRSRTHSNTMKVKAATRIMMSMSKTHSTASQAPMSGTVSKGSTLAAPVHPEEKPTEQPVPALKVLVNSQILRQSAEQTDVQDANDVPEIPEKGPAVNCANLDKDDEALHVYRAAHMDDADSLSSDSTLANHHSSQSRLRTPYGPYRGGRGSLSASTFDSLKTFTRDLKERWYKAKCMRGQKHGLVAHCVRSHWFEYFFTGLVIINAVTIGMQTNYEATHCCDGDNFSRVLSKAEYVFAGLFSVELLFRFYVYRLDFFLSGSWRYNVLDLVVVGMQVCEILVEVIFQRAFSGVSFFLAFRIFRLLRVMRLARILRHVRELRTLIVAIVASLKALFWTLMLLFVLIYYISMYFTQIVTDHRSDTELDPNDPTDIELVYCYGSLAMSMLSMIEALFGGKDWHDLLEPLMKVSIYATYVFLLYIVFGVLAMMNVVTGVFVEKVLEIEKKEKDNVLISNVKDLFKAMGSMRATMNWDTFNEMLDVKQMREAFKAINIDLSEARGLFRLLDLDSSGEVNCEEFIDGCLRLTGPAKALDLSVLIREVAQLRDRLKTQANNIS